MTQAAERRVALRIEGRAEAVVIIMLHVARVMPFIDVMDLARPCGVSEQQIKSALVRIRSDEHERARLVRATAPIVTARRRRLEPISCDRCGREVPRSGHPGQPRRRHEVCPSA